jgi:23S rRNA pseudouridine2605 synthase
MRTTLLKALVGAGFGSRRKAADAVIRGAATVNGAVVDDLNRIVDTERDSVAVDGRRVELKPPQPLYLMLNKPAGVICTASDERGRRTVVDILPERYRNRGLHPVGRLDRDTTGLLLLTSDGDFTQQLTHPRYEREKEYLVCIEGRLSPDDVRWLERGIGLDDGMTYPAAVREVGGEPFTYSVTIHEGRKRQVRRTFAALGHRVRGLERVRIGGLRIGNLPPGEVRELTSGEVRSLLT